MKYQILAILILLFFSCSRDNGSNNDIDKDEDVQTTGVEFDTYMQKISYCIGVDHARGSFNAYNDKKNLTYFDLKEIENGMVDYLAGNDLRIQPWEKDSLLNLYFGADGTYINENIMSKEDAGYCVGMEEAFIMISSLVGRKIDQEVDVQFILIGVQEGFANLDFPTIGYYDAKLELDKYYSNLNLENGKAFMEENLMIEGIVQTESGLQYEVVKEGAGSMPNLTDSVIFHYTGRFIDGRVFSTTVVSLVPYENSVINLIPGQQEGLMLMKEGGQTRFYIPPYLGYGDQRYGQIEPNSTLIYDIDLIKVIRFKPI